MKLCELPSLLSTQSTGLPRKGTAMTEEQLNAEAATPANKSRVMVELLNLKVIDIVYAMLRMSTAERDTINRIVHMIQMHENDVAEEAERRKDRDKTFANMDKTILATLEGLAAGQPVSVPSQPSLHPLKYPYVGVDPGALSGVMSIDPNFFRTGPSAQDMKEMLMEEIKKVKVEQGSKSWQR